MAEDQHDVTLGVAEKIFAAPAAKVREILDIRPVALLQQRPAAASVPQAA